MHSGLSARTTNRLAERQSLIVISRFLKRYLKAKRTRAPAYSRALRWIKAGFQRGVKISSGPVSRIPEGDRVAVKVGVDEMGRVNDQMLGSGALLIGVMEGAIYKS